MARRHVCCTVIEGDFARHDFSAFRTDAVILIGALVHLPHDLFSGVLRNIATALKADVLILLTVKEGDDRVRGADGRIFYLYHDSDLRRTFASLGMDVLDSSRDISRLGTGEIWRSYLLEK
jgi:hypothetical protein